MSLESPPIAPPADVRTAALAVNLGQARREHIAPLNQVGHLIERAERAWGERPEAAVDDLVAADVLLMQGAEGERHDALLAEGAQRIRGLRPELAAYLEIQRARALFLRGAYERSLSLMVGFQRRWEQYRGRKPRGRPGWGWPPEPAYLWTHAVVLQSAAERFLGHADQAAQRCLTLRKTIAAADAAPAELWASFHLGNALSQLGRPEEAEGELRRALQLSYTVGAPRLRALSFCNLGLNAVVLGDNELALGWSIEARCRLDDLGDSIMVGKLLLQEAKLLDRSGRSEEVVSRLREAYAIGVSCGDFETQAEIVSFGRSRLRNKEGRDFAARLRARHKSLVWELSELGMSRLKDGMDRAEEPGPKLVLRGAQVAVHAPGSAAPTIIDLSRRPVLQRVLGRLVYAREQGLGWVSASALLSAGWPGERPTRESGLNRVYATVRTLRRLGLEVALETGPHGYRLVWGVQRG